MLHNWATRWHMSFNADKTKYMIVSKKQSIDTQNLYLADKKLDNVSSFKHLGLYFDDKMTWETHVKHLVSKVNKKIGLLWKVGTHFPRKCTDNIYCTYVRPLLDYGCSVYDGMNRQLCDQLEAVQRRAALACTRAFNRTSSKALLNELGWPSLESRRKYFRLVQLYRIKNNLTPEYLHTILPPVMG